VLYEETGRYLLERIVDVKRDFPSILDLGAHDGFLAGKLAQRDTSFVVASDLSAKMLKGGMYPHGVVADEEFLPFAEQSFDLIVSNLSLHWVNDLPGALAQIKRALKPGGLFLAALLGGQTLHELRSSLLEAELAVHGGISPRLSPSIDMQTASTLLQRAGFQLPVTDQEIVTFSYSDSFALMRDLRGMGETNAHVERGRAMTPREVFLMADQIYKARFGMADGRIPASFHAVFLHGWV
jgi:SAM-dependent methyltransferase